MMEGPPETDRKRLRAELTRTRLELSQTRDELERRSRAHARVAQLVRRLAHRLASPLGVIRGRLQLLGRNLPDNKRVRETIEIANRQVVEIDQTLRAAVAFAEMDASALEVIPVLELVQSAVNGTSDPGASDVVLEDGTSDLFVVGDRALLTRALENIIDNALRSQPGEGVVQVRLGQERDRVRISVIDRGCGMDQEVLERAFEPMYSRRPAGEGLGLGLSFAAVAVEGAGGSIRIDSTPEQGTCCTVDLVTAPHPGDDSETESDADDDSET